MLSWRHQDRLLRADLASSTYSLVASSSCCLAHGPIPNQPQPCTSLLTCPVPDLPHLDPAAIGLLRGVAPALISTPQFELDGMGSPTSPSLVAGPERLGQLMSASAGASPEEESHAWELGEALLESRRLASSIYSSATADALGAQWAPERARHGLSRSKISKSIFYYRCDCGTIHCEDYFPETSPGPSLQDPYACKISITAAQSPNPCRQERTRTGLRRAQFQAPRHQHAVDHNRPSLTTCVALPI